MELSQDFIDRFRRDLDTLVDPDARLGIAVSGGPDSLALLLLAAAARRGKIAAATVDHGLRAESRAEAEMVGAVCAGLAVPHRILDAEWAEMPHTAVQEKARGERYRLLGLWAQAEGLDALVTAHHLHDQAETFVMRLARGAGVRGLSAMRRAAATPGCDIPLLRPLLAWQRYELADVCAQARLAPVEDPSNADERFERVRIRDALSDAAWPNAQAIAASADHLAEADQALEWAVDRSWESDVTVTNDGAAYRPADAPAEIKRRVVARILGQMAREGNASDLRGAELDRLLLALAKGEPCTLRGVLCRGGNEWQFVPAPHRTRRGNHGF